MRSDFVQPAAAPSIEDYAAIGNCRTLALVSRFGSIDWWCLPDFSGPSIFAALLDSERGGRFALTPLGIDSAEQHYEPLSNVLRTRFQCRSGVLDLVDFMVMPEGGGPAGTGSQAQEIVRIATCVAGTVELQAVFQPRPDYASRLPSFICDRPGLWRCTVPGLALQLSSSISLQAIEPHTLSARVPMGAGARHFALLRTPAAPEGVAASPAPTAASRPRPPWHCWVSLGGCLPPDGELDQVASSRPGPTGRPASRSR